MMTGMHELFRITAAEVIGPATLRVHFDDGVERIVDLRRALRGAVYGPLAAFEFFAQVRVDPEVHTVEWPNGADFDPETLRNWADYEEDWATAAARWDSSAAG